jgi:general secretion pathway protein I
MNLNHKIYELLKSRHSRESGNPSALEFLKRMYSRLKTSGMTVMKRTFHKVIKIRTDEFTIRIFQRGFTLIEVLVAVSIMGIAIAVILQLFSANLRNISDSGDYVEAATRAEVKMREILDNNSLLEKSYSEITNDGYRMDVAVAETLKERTENLQVRLFEVALTVHWTKGTKEKSMTLRSMKVVRKEI